MSQQPSSTSHSHYLAHVISWIGGLMLVLTPFIHTWYINANVPVRLGANFFGINIMIFALLFILGSAIGGYWWRFCNWLSGGSRIMLYFYVLFFYLAHVAILIAPSGEAMHEKTAYALKAGSLTLYPGVMISSLAVIVLIAGLIAACFLNGPAEKRELGTIKEWFSKKYATNSLFWILFFTILSVNFAFTSFQLAIPTSEKISLFIGRMFFAAAITCLIYLITEFAMRATPSKLRWVIWLMVSLLPALVLNDIALNQLYGRGQLELLNSLTSNGEIAVMKELEGGGFKDITETHVALMISGFILGSLLLAGVLWYFSRNKQRPYLKTAMLLTLVCYIANIAEQAIGKSWKNPYTSQLAHKAFILNNGLVAPKLGLAEFNVAFRTYHSDTLEFEPTSELPDIYVIMVESMRYDSMDERTTPFLTEFRKECQQLDSTWSGSNATHLSWFSFTYSKPSLFWNDEINSIKDKKSFAGSPLLQTLKHIGYNIEVRAVCDLGYKDFGLLNFGSDLQLVSVIEQSRKNHSKADEELTQFNIPEREQLTFDRLKKSILTKSETKGGNFYYTALDSPHYNYYWHKDFKVPYADYKEDITFPLFPSKDEIKLYHNRYRNAVGWIDYEVKDFVSFLKANGRYDNSIIILTGDHGEEFQEAGGWCHCTSLMKEQTSVPILIKWPKNMANQPKQALASHMDIMPSVLAYLGAPEEQLSQLAGRNLLDSNDSDHSLLVATNYANKDGETMMLKRGEYTAYFSWSNPWNPRVPSEMRLERITDGNGMMQFPKDTDFKATLEKLFPDAFERYFEKLELAE